jgi:alkanesulfonate monooxygenase SsuD/methylene tetrahydromethanopterin reductase-like flavin-dependent oxidoreductase (luciferase family)
MVEFSVFDLVNVADQSRHVPLDSWVEPLQLEALDLYRARFAPSGHEKTPYAMAGINVIVAETDTEAERLFTSNQQRVIDILRGTRGYLKPPIDDIAAYGSPAERAQADNMLSCSFVGSPTTVEAKLRDFVDRTEVDELIVASAVFDHQTRLQSHGLLDDIAARMSDALAIRRKALP